MKYLETYNERLKWETRVPWLNQTEISEKQFNYRLKKYCSDVDLKTDNMIYRAVDLQGKYYHIKQIGERKSAYAGNYYTLLMNNLPSWSEYPKRTHICTNVQFDYRDNNSYRVIPMNGAKIGILPTDDVQADWFNETDFEFKEYFKSFTQIESFYTNLRGNRILKHHNRDDFNRKCNEYMSEHRSIFDISDNSWEEFNSDLLKIAAASKDMFEQITLNSDDYLTTFDKPLMKDFLKMFDINELNKIFDPKKLDIDCFNYNEYKNFDLGPNKGDQLHYNDNDQHEIWLDGDVLLMKL